MGFNLFGVKEPKARANYQLTPLGKTKAEEFRVTGPKGSVMSMLDDSGPSTIQEVANEVKMSPERVKRILNSLMADGWVRRVSSEA